MPSCLLFEFGYFGWIMAVGQLNAVSKLRNLSLSILTMEFSNHRACLCPILEIWDLTQNISQAIRPFEGALTCSILIAGTQKAYYQSQIYFSWEMVLVNARILDS
jgi:hypothetical protein